MFLDCLHVKSLLFALRPPAQAQPTAAAARPQRASDAPCQQARQSLPPRPDMQPCAPTHSGRHCNQHGRARLGLPSTSPHACPAASQRTATRAGNSGIREFKIRNFRIEEF